MTDFSAEQKQLLRNAIAADTTQDANVANGEHGLMAAWFNAPSTFQVWRRYTAVADIQDNVVWANFTPANPAAGVGSDATNWLLACQGKQFNLQMLLTGFAVSTDKSNIRAGLQDATTQIPSGVNGATKNGGWSAIQLAIQRPATRAEKALASGTGSSAVPGLLSFEGIIQNEDIYQIFVIG